MIKTIKPLAEANRPSLTLREIAVLESCSVKTVRRAIAANVLQAYRSGSGGRLLRVTWADFDAYRRANRL